MQYLVVSIAIISRYILQSNELYNYITFETFSADPSYLLLWRNWMASACSGDNACRKWVCVNQCDTIPLADDAIRHCRSILAIRYIIFIPRSKNKLFFFHDLKNNFLIYIYCRYFHWSNFFGNPGQYKIIFLEIVKSFFFELSRQYLVALKITNQITWANNTNISNRSCFK